MRRILTAKEYGSMIATLSDEELHQVAFAVTQEAVKLMERHALSQVVILCTEALEQIAELSLKLLESKDVPVQMARLGLDELPDLSKTLICDLLFTLPGDDRQEQNKAAWIEGMALSRSPVLSVAIPAGVGPDSGKAEPLAVSAEATVVPFAYMPGLFLHNGLDYCGEILPVGGETVIEKGCMRFEASDAKALLPPRKRTAHKGDSGKALLCVGSAQYVGAALLSARACLAAGCGILYVACPDQVKLALHALPEAIGRSVGPEWSSQSAQVAIAALQGMGAVGVGCGVGGGDISSLIEAALRSRLPMVLDADGLNCLSRHPKLYPLLHERVILTPHPGEMGRLLGAPTAQILEDPMGVAIRFAKAWRCTVLLKGAATVVTDGKRLCLVAEGNAGLGKGGSGDALTGIIVGLLAQGLDPFSGACLGSYLLGASAQQAFSLLRERMLRATNVIEALELNLTQQQ